MSAWKARKPTCNFCKKSGKTEQDYSSHYTKDRKGVVCCPVLLSIECAYCYQLGHTTKFCQDLKSLNKLKEDIYKREMSRIKELHKQCVEAKKAKVAKQTNPNRFYNLAEESDSDGSISSCCSPKPKPVSRFANITLRKHQQDWHYDEYDDYDVISELTDSDDDEDDESSEFDDAVDAKRQQMLDDEELIEQYFDDGDCRRNR